MEIRAVLFDKDGTLIDFHATWAGFARRAALEAAGRDGARAAHLLEALGLDRKTARFRPGSVLAAGTGADVAAVLWPGEQGGALQRRIAALDDLAAAHARDHAIALEGIPEALRGLRASGRMLGIATNDSERGARETMARLGLDGLFAEILGYDSVPRAKPWPDMIHPSLLDLQCLQEDMPVQSPRGHSTVAQPPPGHPFVLRPDTRPDRRAHAPR